HISLDVTGRSLAVLRESPSEPADVWVTTGGAGIAAFEVFGLADSAFPLNQVTFSLMGGVRPTELSRGEMTVYNSFDGQKIHALGPPPPAIVRVHGGPNGQQMMTFNPFLHVLAEAGFVVIVPNYRGSTGYGKAFEDANNKDWGGADLKDLTAAVRHFAARGE